MSNQPLRNLVLRWRRSGFSLVFTGLIALNDPFAEGFVGLLHDRLIDLKLLFSSVLRDQLQSKLEILKFLRAQISDGTRVLG